MTSTSSSSATMSAGMKVKCAYQSCANFMRSTHKCILILSNYQRESICSATFRKSSALSTISLTEMESLTRLRANLRASSGPLCCLIVPIVYLRRALSIVSGIRRVYLLYRTKIGRPDELKRKSKGTWRVLGGWER